MWAAFMWMFVGLSCWRELHRYFWCIVGSEKQHHFGREEMGGEGDKRGIVDVVALIPAMPDRLMMWVIDWPQRDKKDSVRKSERGRERECVCSREMKLTTHTISPFFISMHAKHTCKLHVFLCETWHVQPFLMTAYGSTTAVETRVYSFIVY